MIIIRCFVVSNYPWPSGYSLETPIVRVNSSRSRAIWLITATSQTPERPFLAMCTVPREGSANTENWLRRKMLEDATNTRRERVHPRLR